MDIQIIDYGGVPIAELSAGVGEISDVQAALDLMADAGDQGARHLLVTEEHLPPAFFDLRSGLAGEILQKFINYNVRLAIIGDFAKYNSRSLQAFIVECNRGRDFTFCSDRDSAMDRLARQVS